MIDVDHPPHHAVRDCFFAWEVMRKLGFPSDVLYPGPGGTPMGQVAREALHYPPSLTPETP